jgi:hypothetical protein
MRANLHYQTPGRTVRLLICAALACAITALTTQVIISSASHLEYGIAASTAPVAAAASDTARHMLVASAS